MTEPVFRPAGGPSAAERAEALAAARAALGLDDGPLIVRSAAAMREHARASGGDEHLPRAVVMTMGALHEGHATLVRGAREWTATRYDVDPADVEVVVTLFVNPLQFGPGEDYDRYPRAFDADVELCRREGVDVVFAPSVEQVYPDGTAEVTVDPGPLGDVLEGEVRPGHFRGMLTVVLKLLHLTAPHAAFFGEKDYQQLTLIRRMVRDLDLDVYVVGVPTVREPDGLAMSSRNAYLDPEQRAAATALVLTLAAGQEAAEAGHPADVLEGALAEFLAAQPGVGSVDYVAVRDVDLGPAPESGEARLLVAARVGGVRLIDNARVDLGGEPS